MIDSAFPISTAMATPAAIAAQAPLPPGVTIRLLTREDGPAYQRLRLQSLQTDPNAFLSLYENEVKLHEDVFGNHLDWAYHPPHFGYWGIFVENARDMAARSALPGGEPASWFSSPGRDNESDEPQLAGYVQVSQNYLEKQEHIALLSNLYVAPAFRGRHLGTLLFDHIFALLNQSEKIERLFLSCTASNKHAYRFYQHIGFRRYGVKVKAIKWQGKYDDEVEMVKVLV